MHFLVQSQQAVQILVIEFFREVMVMKVEILNYHQPQDYLLILIEGICKVEGTNVLLAQLIVLLQETVIYYQDYDLMLDGRVLQKLAVFFKRVKTDGKLKAQVDLFYRYILNVYQNFPAKL